MRTVIYYNFDELTVQAQKAAIKNNRWKVMDIIMDGYSSDYRDTLKALSEATGFEAYNYEVSYCGMHYNVRTCRDNYDSILEHFSPGDVTGRLLHRYVGKIIDNFAKGKFYSTSGHYDLNGKYHYKYRHSRVMIQYDNCTLTGMCYEVGFAQKLLHYFEHCNEYAQDYSLQNLMEECYNEVFKDWKSEYGYYGNEDEGIAEFMESNEWEFTEYGIAV